MNEIPRESVCIEKGIWLRPKITNKPTTPNRAKPWEQPQINNGRRRSWNHTGARGGQVMSEQVLGHEDSHGAQKRATLLSFKLSRSTFNLSHCLKAACLPTTNARRPRTLASHVRSVKEASTHGEWLILSLGTKTKSRGLCSLSISSESQNIF